MIEITGCQITGAASAAIEIPAPTHTTMPAHDPGEVHSPEMPACQRRIYTHCRGCHARTEWCLPSVATVRAIVDKTWRCAACKGVAPC